MIALKLMTCSVTATVFFKKFFKNLTSLQVSALAVSYALCGYSMMFYQLHTWLDVMYMFPLFLVAAKKLLTENKIVPYIITLSMMILFQFYLGYMLALFIIFAFSLYLVFFVKELPDKKRSIVIFAIGTIISALLTAPVWLCAFMQYRNSARGVNLITSLSSGELYTRFDTTLPFIFATILILINIPFFIKLKLYKNEKAKPVLFMFILMIIPIIIEPINKMWHTGSYQAFPVSYNFV